MRFVWPDSFEVYIEPALCSDRDPFAGWKAQTTAAEYTEDLTTNLIRFGPKPIPKPKPPTLPGQKTAQASSSAQLPSAARVGYRLNRLFFKPAEVAKVHRARHPAVNSCFPREHRHQMPGATLIEFALGILSSDAAWWRREVC